MADIDDELLALAGSDEDESGDESRQASLSPEPADRSGSESGSGRRKPDSKGPTSRGRRDDSDDDGEVEEGEASSAPSSPSSLKSAPMDESDSDAEPQRDDGGNDDLEEKYPIEGLYVSLAEKAEISRMREVERETILAERREENQRFKQNRMLRQLVSAAEEKEKEQRRKRSADDADLDDQRKSSRQRTRIDRTRAGETSSGIDTLRRARAEKNDRMRRREEDRERQREKPTPTKSRDRDYGYDDEDEEDRDDRRRSPERETRNVEAQLVDFERLRISRNNFAEVCFKPGFEKALTDCYVRVLGKPVGGQQQYHMVCIKGFTSGKAYAMADVSGQKQFVTDQHVLAGIGSKTEHYPFIAMSSGKFTEEELERYKKVLRERGLTVPKKSSLDKKLDELRALVAYRLTNDEITSMVEKKNLLRKKYDPEAREKLVKAVEDAKAANNPILANQLQAELDSLGKAAGLAFRTSLTPQKSGLSSNQQDRLAKLNADIRRRNNEEVRRAQLQERQRAREIEQKLARGEAVQDDLSKRLRTRAKFVHDFKDNLPKTGSTPNSGASTPNGTPKSSSQKQVLPQIAKLQEQKYAENKGIPTVHKPLMDDDIIASLDLEIDVEID
ncbi:hypothetical protein jhhlp_006424 [Lomentospora prolificans]|uniref:Plus3 domain-containing protein n=1 Tax=Lomentospora prolificans TaxID=41688 RepID=A0A2N3N5W2_9PEZI|nr:hypothetical protein jhhlp_006424 [Lomentospora prolificans]